MNKQFTLFTYSIIYLLINTTPSFAQEAATEFIQSEISTKQTYNAGSTKPHTAQTLKEFLESGGSPDLTRDHKISLLHDAASSGNINNLELLLSHNASLQALTAEGQNALHLAAENNQLLAAQILINKGISTDSKTKRGYAPIHLAAANDNLEIIQLLAANAANLTATNSFGESPIAIAIKNKHASVVEYLFEKNPNPNDANFLKETLLHTAARTGNTQLIEFLLDHNADMYAQSIGGKTPFQVAVECGHIQSAVTFIEHGFDVKKVDIKVHKALIATIIKAHEDEYVFYGNEEITDGDYHSHEARIIELIQSLITQGLSFHNLQIENGESLLHWAINTYLGSFSHHYPNRYYERLPTSATAASLNLIHFLIDNDADINSKTDNNLTPLHLAVQSQQVDIITKLLAKGADMNVESEGWPSGLPIEAALADYNFNAEIVKLLLRHGSKVPSHTGWYQTPTLILATQKADLELLELFLEANLDINSEDKDQHTALYYALSNQHIEKTRLLLQKGASIPLYMGWNNIPTLIWAIQFDYSEILNLLLEKNPNVNALDSRGMTAMHHAVDKENLKLVQKLIEKGGKVNVESLSGDFPIHIAAENNDLPMVQLLLENNSVIPQGVNGKMPLLCWAAKRGYTDIIKLLLEKGANPNVNDPLGMTPLHYAAQGNFPEIIELLLQRDASVIAEDRDNRTPLTLARNYYHHRIINLITNYMVAHGINVAAYEKVIDYTRDLRSDKPSVVIAALSALHQSKGLENYFLIGMNNMHFGYTDGVDNVATSIAKDKKNGYAVCMSDELLAREDLVIYFSLFINPGQGDSFSQTSEPIFDMTHLDINKMRPMERTYQKLLDVVHKFEIPYLGICSGNQHLILKSKGSLTYFGYIALSDQNSVTMSENTHGHYLALSETEKAKHLNGEHIGSITISKTGFAHSYAGVEHAIGERISVDGRSNLNVVQFISKDGIYFGCQFHPERLYFAYTPEFNRQRQILDGIFDIAYKRHSLRSSAVKNGFNIADPLLKSELKIASQQFSQEILAPNKAQDNSTEFTWNIVREGRLHHIEQTTSIFMPFGFTFAQTQLQRTENDLHITVAANNNSYTLVINNAFNVSPEEDINNILQLTFQDGTYYEVILSAIPNADNSVSNNGYCKAEAFYPSQELETIDFVSQ